MTKPPKKPLEVSESDKEIFQDAVKHVKPLRQKQRHIPDTLPTPVQRQKTKIKREYPAAQLSDGIGIDELSAASVLSYYQNGLSPKQLRQLQTGMLHIEDVLDLHNNTVDQARELLWHFVLEHFEAGTRTILIIHGKGQRAQDSTAILKSHVNHWLKQIPEVLAFHSAIPKHGGLGACYLLLKRKKDCE